MRIVFISTGQQEPRDGKKYKNEEGKHRGALKKNVLCNGMLMGTKDFKLKQLYSNKKKMTKKGAKGVSDRLARSSNVGRGDGVVGKMD